MIYETHIQIAMFMILHVPPGLLSTLDVVLPSLTKTFWFSFIVKLLLLLMLMLILMLLLKLFCTFAFLYDDTRKRRAVLYCCCCWFCVDDYDIVVSILFKVFF